MASTREPTDQEIKETLALLNAMDSHRKFNQIEYFKPINQQRKAMFMSKTKREVCFFAGNRCGKSETGAFKAACHATGKYPDWWEGIRFDRPTKGWVAGTTGLDVRNIAQTKLCGQYGVTSAFGTGMIPKSDFADKPTLARGVTDAFDTLQVKHYTRGVYDGISTIAFKSYEQGRKKFQGEQLDWGWADEEPPMTEDNDVYTEFLTRIVGSGCMFITFTPMDGQTKLTDRFIKHSSDDRGYVLLDLTDPEITWWTDEEKRKMIEAYPEWQRKARVNGLPLLGSGAVFPFDENIIKEMPLDYIPNHWPSLWSIDFGIGHPFAAVMNLHDRDTDTIHVTHVIRMADADLLYKVRAMRAIGAEVPVAWPHDGHQRQEASGGQDLALLYRKEGLRMLPDHATFEAGGYSTEAGVAEMISRMKSNRYKVASHLSEYFEEFRGYHRKGGLIVKERDDIMSAARVGVMAIRQARLVPLGGPSYRKPNMRTTAEGTHDDSDDPWAVSKFD